MSSKNAGRGRPAVDSERVDTRLQRDVLNALDAFAAAELNKPSRPEAIRRILTDDLQRRGFLPSNGTPDEGTRPDELDSTNDD